MLGGVADLPQLSPLERSLVDPPLQLPHEGAQPAWEPIALVNGSQGDLRMCRANKCCCKLVLQAVVTSRCHKLLLQAVATCSCYRLCYNL